MARPIIPSPIGTHIFWDKAQLGSNPTVRKQNNRPISILVRPISLLSI